MTRVAINGFGRIGRLVFRKLIVSDEVISDKIEVVAINDLASTKDLAYLLEHDSAQGSLFPNNISYTKDTIVVCGKQYRVFSEKDAANLPWKKLNIDIVVESTGFYLTNETASRHLGAGAKHVILSAPHKGKGIKTIVYGVNHSTLSKSDKIISAASCTTNCLAPVIDVLDKNFTFKSGYMTTIHSVTNDQRTLDLSHKDLRRGRAAFHNIIPTTTGAAIAVGEVIPHVKGKLDGLAFRVPTITGSVVDLTCFLEKKVTASDINLAFKNACSRMLDYTEQPIVSSDIIGSSFGSVVDGLLTKVINTDNGQIIKVVSWYDNEMSYVSQFVRTLQHLSSL